MMAAAAFVALPAHAETLEQCTANCQTEKTQCISRAQAAIDRGDAGSIEDCGDDCEYQISSGCESSREYCVQDCTSNSEG